MNEAGVPSGDVVYGMQWLLNAPQDYKWATLLS